MDCKTQKQVKQNTSKLKKACASLLALALSVTTLTEKVEAMTIPIYQLTEPDGQMTLKRWLEPPASLPHGNVDEIWTGPNDPVTGFPTHPNLAQAVISLEPDWVFGGPDNQMESGGYVLFLQDTWIQEINSNTGERGEVWIKICCGIPKLLQRTIVNTPTSDRGLLDPVLIPAGVHFIKGLQSDLSANQGFQLQFSANQAGPYVNMTSSTHSMWKEDNKPSVQCIAHPACDPVPEGWSIHQPKMCDPVFEPIPSSGLSEDEVLALIPAPTVVPDQEICAGNFAFASTREGWLHPRTPLYTVNSGTVIGPWEQVGNTWTAPCDMDIEVKVQFGNTYFRLDNAYGREWTDVRLLINGAQAQAFTFHDYDYKDRRENANLLKADINGPKVALFARVSVPAGSVVSVQTLRRHNFIMGTGGGRGDVISGLRANWSVAPSPVVIVTGRV